jgi:DNA-binding transcriptional ArsR family regulator
MLDKVLGSEVAMKIMFHLIHYGEIYPTAVANDYKLSLSAVQKQFERYEQAGILVSKLVGKTRVYFFNKKSKAAIAFMNFIKIYYDGLSIEDREKIFSERRRPRRGGKPVLKKGQMLDD